MEVRSGPFSAGPLPSQDARKSDIRSMGGLEPGIGGSRLAEGLDALHEAVDAIVGPSRYGRAAPSSHGREVDPKIEIHGSKKVFVD
jgi:hypothetical protein